MVLNAGDLLTPVVVDDVDAVSLKYTIKLATDVVLA